MKENKQYNCTLLQQITHEKLDSGELVCQITLVILHLRLLRRQPLFTHCINAFRLLFLSLCLKGSYIQAG